MENLTHIIQKGGIYMWDFFINATIWTLAFYGLYEIIKNIIYIFSYTNLKSNGIYVIVAAKNQENIIEGFIRGILFRFLYGKEDNIKDIIIADLNSKDSTKQILDKMKNDYNNIQITTWKECKEIIDNINVS